MSYLLSEYSPPCTEHQKEITEFRTLLKNDSFFNPTINPQNTRTQYYWDVIHNDCVCLKFLKAENFNIQHAYNHFKESVKFRLEKSLDFRITQPSPLQLAYNTHEQICFHGYTKNINGKAGGGYPIYIQRIGSSNMNDILNAGTLEDRIDTHKFKSEYLRHVIFPEASKNANKRIDQIFVVVDMKGLNFSHLKKLQYTFVKTLSQEDQLIYPERLYRLIMVNVPSLFAIVWGICKNWLNEGLKEKFTIVSHNGLNELLEYIDKKDLPLFLGGECICQSHVNDDRATHTHDEKDPMSCLYHHPIQYNLLQASQTGIKFEDLQIDSQTMNHIKYSNNSANQNNKNTENPMENSKSHQMIN